MASIVRVELVSYRNPKTMEWLNLEDASVRRVPVKRVPIRTIEFPEQLPRMLIGVVHLRSDRPMSVQVEVQLQYTLMSRRTMSGIEKTVTCYQGTHSEVVQGKKQLWVPIEHHALEGFFFSHYPSLTPKSVIFQACLLSTQRSRWYSWEAKYLYTPWGD